MATILVFGDSIAWGAWDTQGGWVQRLRKEIDKKNLTDPQFYCSVYNLGISGDTSRGLITRMEYESSIRIKIESEKPIIVIAIGTNDARYITSKKINQVPIEEFRENIATLIKKSKKLTSQIILVSPGKVNESRVNTLPQSTERLFRNQDLQEYSQVIQQEAEKEEVQFVNVYEEFDENMILDEDGLHPNDLGHEMISKKIREMLIQKKILQL